MCKNYYLVFTFISPRILSIDVSSDDNTFSNVIVAEPVPSVVNNNGFIGKILHYFGVYTEEINIVGEDVEIVNEVGINWIHFNK